MKTHQMQESLEIKHIIEQLKGYQYFETEGKTKRELAIKLAAKRAAGVRIQSPDSNCV